MKGRKPTPTAIKNLKGTARPDRVMSNEAQFPLPGRMLNPPDGLNADGELLWRSLGKLLLDAGLFTYGDRIALELLCIAYGRMKKANRMVDKDGMVCESDKGNLYQNPYLSIANRAWDQVKGMLSEFGLTPAERSRVMAAVEEKVHTLADDLFAAVQNAENAKDKA